MISKKRVAVYPFESEFAPVVRHRSLLKEYEITVLISPKGWALGEKDAGCADKGSSVGMKVVESLEDRLDLFDTLWIVDSNIPLDFKKIVYPKILLAIESGKDVICTAKLDEEIREEICKACVKKGTDFNYVCSTDNSDETGINNAVGIESISEIRVPVIVVAGMAEGTHKFEIQLTLREQFLNKGYRISQIGTRNYCEFLGFHSFPRFMSSCISESSKIVLFNEFVRNIEIKEKPDAIIIGIPGGVLPFNGHFTNKFGITAYEICQAVSADAAILSILYEEFEMNFFEMISASMKYRLGINVDCYNLSNKQVQWAECKEKRSVTYASMNCEFIEKKKERYSELDIPVFNMLNGSDASQMGMHIIKTLEGYAQTGIL